jgi:hypothetical protein
LAYTPVHGPRYNNSKKTIHQDKFRSCRPPSMFSRFKGCHGRVEGGSTTSPVVTMVVRFWTQIFLGFSNAETASAQQTACTRKQPARANSHAQTASTRKPACANRQHTKTASARKPPARANRQRARTASARKPSARANRQRAQTASTRKPSARANRQHAVRANRQRRQQKKWIQHHTVPGWSPTPVLSRLKPR